MHNLIITIFSIALMTATIAVTMAFTGDSATHHATVPPGVEAVFNQVQNIEDAIELRSVSDTSAITSLQQLVAQGYLNALPLPPAVIYASGQPPSVADWEILKPGTSPVVMLYEKISQFACELINKKYNGDASILAAPRFDKKIQCVGPAEPYSLLLHSSGDKKFFEESIPYFGEIALDLTATYNRPVALLQDNQTYTGDLIDSLALPNANASPTIDFRSRITRLRPGANFGLENLTWEINVPSVPSTNTGLTSGMSFNSTGVLSGVPAYYHRGMLFEVVAKYRGYEARKWYSLPSQPITGSVSDAVQVSSGRAHTCWVTTINDVYCVGAGDKGQLGNSQRTAYLDVPYKIPALSRKISKVVAAGDTTCAVWLNGDVSCWGDTALGQAGQGNYGVDVIQTSPTLKITELSNIVNIEGSRWIDSTICASNNGGDLWCWGHDGASLATGGASQADAALSISVPLPGGSKLARATPYPIAFSASVSDFKVGTNHSCVLLAGGGVRCWGTQATDESRYNLGTGGPATVAVQPETPVGLETGVTAIGLHYRGGCAIIQDASVKCWGGNSVGSLGVATTKFSHLETPTTIPSLKNISYFLNYANEGLCAVDTSNQVLCWGDTRARMPVASAEQLLNNSSKPAVRPIPSGFQQLSLGPTSCGIWANKLKCWGGMWAAQGGSKTMQNDPHPMPAFY